MTDLSHPSAASRQTPNGEAGTAMLCRSEPLTDAELLALAERELVTCDGVGKQRKTAIVAELSARLASRSADAVPTPDVTHNAGAGFSEDAIRAAGHDFASWEAGFSAACGVIRARLSSVGASADTERVASALFEVRRRAALVGKRMDMALAPDCERTEQVSAVMQAVEQYRAALSQEARP